jgi:hypothetical protein
MIELIRRRLRCHWRLDLAILLGLMVISALAASLAGYGAAVSNRELNRMLEAAGPAQRSLLITGNRAAFRDDLYVDLQDTLGTLLKERLVIRYSTLPADSPTRDGAAERRMVETLALYSFDKLPENVRLVEGSLPAPVRLVESVGFWPPPMDAVIGRRAAEQSGYSVGDRVTATHFYHRLDIVGIVEPADPDADLWGGDLSAFAVPTGAEQADSDSIALPLIIAPESMQSYLQAPVFPHDVAWRITLNHHRIDPDTAQALRTDLANLQTQSATRGARTSTGLLQLLGDFLARASRVRAALLLLTAQTLILDLYVLAIFASLLVERARFEIAILAARGMSAAQITRLWTLEILTLALPAGLLLGPGLAYVVVRLWAAASDTASPPGLSGNMWLLSAAATAAGWAVLTLSVGLAAWRAVRTPGAVQTRPGQHSFLHRRYVDLYLLAFGGLLVWQLNRSGSFLARVVTGGRLEDTPLADPLLLLGPFVLLIAVAITFLRIIPFLLGLAARLFQHQRGWLLPLGLLRPARDPQRASRLVLLISLASGLALFAGILADALTHGQELLRSDALVQGIARVFQLNTVMLALFGASAFLLAHLAAAQSPERTRPRAGELDTLRSLGLPAHQQPPLTVVEGILVLGVGLFSGVALGLGLSYAMIPTLLDSLVEPLVVPGQGASVQWMMINWTLAGRIVVGLAVVYGFALALAWIVLQREQPRPAPWIGDE